FPQEERLAVCLDEGVPIISFFWRDPAALVPRAKAGRSARPRRRAEPWTAASMSSLRRAGKRAATCAERLPPCHSFPPLSTPYHPRPSLPPVESPTAVALPPSSRSAHRAHGSERGFLPATRRRFTRATASDC